MLGPFYHKDLNFSLSHLTSIILLPLLVKNNSLLRIIIKFKLFRINVYVSVLRNFLLYKGSSSFSKRLDLIWILVKNIQAIQYENNMTQDQVVAKLNLMGISITESTYAKLETNRMNIKASELVAFAKLFYTDINAFFSSLL